MKKSSKTRKVWIVILCALISLLTTWVLVYAASYFSSYKISNYDDILYRSDWNNLMDDLDDLSCPTCPTCPTCDTSCTKAMVNPDGTKLLQRRTSAGTSFGLMGWNGEYIVLWNGMTNTPGITWPSTWNPSFCGSARTSWREYDLLWQKWKSTEFCAVLNSSDICSTLRSKTLYITAPYPYENSSHYWLNISITSCGEGWNMKFKVNDFSKSLGNYCISMGDGSNIFSTYDVTNK